MYIVTVWKQHNETALLDVVRHVCWNWEVTKQNCLLIYVGENSKEDHKIVYPPGVWKEIKAYREINED